MVTLLVTSVRGHDLDDPTIPRHPDGSITRPPSGGLGCPACADHANVHSPCLLYTSPSPRDRSLS
eukprot:4367046-Pyramimonas_sp.AAC.1